MSSSSSSPPPSSSSPTLPPTSSPTSSSTTINSTSSPTITPPPSSTTVIPPPTSLPPTTLPPSNDPTSLTTTLPPTSQPSSDPPDNQPTSLDPTTPPPSQSTTTSDPDTTSTPPPASTTTLPTITSFSTTIDSLSIDTVPPTSFTPTITPASTFSSTVFISSTDSRGSVTRTAPALITSVATSTKSDGTITTITQVIANPTLIGNTNSSTRTSAFFKNTGAVAGVFILVGLAVISIILWVIFAVRRRRRHQRLDHDTAVSATLAAAGFHRTPLVDDDEDQGAHSTPSRYSPAPSNPFMGQRSSSALGLTNRASIPYLQADHDPEFVVPGTSDFNPYAEYVPTGTPTRTDGYVPVPAPTAAPIFPFPYRDRSSGNFDSQGAFEPGHTRTSSIEPLIGGPNSIPLRRSSPLSTLPPAYNNEDTPFGVEIARAMGAPDASGSSSMRSQQTDTVPDARLDPGLMQRLTGQEVVADDGASLFRDEEDYSRPVLGVRNMPDTASQT